MRISAKAEYACLSLIEHARPGSAGVPVCIRDIAESQGIPERYLVQILQQLKAGLVLSADRIAPRDWVFDVARESSLR